MIVVPQMVLKQLIIDIVGATHGLQDETGEPHISATIPEAMLRMAAITAIQIATGESIWPGDRIIKIKRPRVRQGIFEEME